MLDPSALPLHALSFLEERHLATLTTLRADGTPHVVPVGFTYEPATATARVITSRGSVKAGNVAAGSRAALCQVDGRRWLTLEGAATLVTDPAAVLDAEQRYAARYQAPRPNRARAVLVVAVDRVLGRP